MRRVVSLWLPRFATDRLRRLAMNSPDGVSTGRLLTEQDKPLVTILTAGGRQTVAAVDRKAAAAGLRPGLPLADARALVPDLAIRPVDPEGEAATLARLAEWCGRYSPWTAVEAAEDGSEAGIRSGAGLWLDVTGCAHLFGGEAALLGDLLSRFRRWGYAARAALADAPGAAWALARFQDETAGDALAIGSGAGSDRGVVLAPGGARAGLAPLPVAALRLAPEVTDGLARLGLRRIGDLYPMPRATLVRRFGPAPGLRLDQALGRVAEPISPRLPTVDPVARLVFAEPILHIEGLTEGLRRLTAELCRILAAAALGARRLGLVFYRVDGGVCRVRIGTSRPTRDPAALQRLFAERLDALDPGFGIEAMTLTALETGPLPARQMALAGRQGAPPGTEADDMLAPLVDRLGNRLGLAAIVRFSPRESHLPERAVATKPALDPDVPPDASSGARRPMPPRPLRLLAHPEPVEVTALLPDHPPVLFRWRARLHRVARAEGPERIAPEWWRAPCRGEPFNAVRDYFQVEDEDGRRFWLYREGSEGAGRWYLHGLFA